VTHAVRCAVAALVFILAGNAEAQVMTFDELSPTENPILGSVVCVDGTGFRFVSDHFHLIGPTFVTDYTSSGTTHIGYESGRGYPIVMERVGGGTFSLFSLDVAEFYSAPTDRPDAETLTITGFQQGGGTVSYTVSVDGLRDGPGGVADFEHVVLPSTFANLTSVMFTGFRAGNLAGGIALDNIAYQLAAPETLAACVAIPLPPDTPTVTITSPAAGTVAGTVHVAATATDSAGVASVQFKLDGTNLGAADVTAPYSISWDSTTVADGPHTITAEARDADDNAATASVIVAVQNHPVVPSGVHYLDFDGVDDYLLVTDAPNLSFGNGAADTPLTFEAWIKPDAMVRHHLISKWESARAEYKLHIASGMIRLDLRDESAGTTVSAFTSTSQMSVIGSWHHVAATYDGRGGATAANGITIYVDGVAVPLTRFNNAAYVAMENLSAPLQIGREGPNWKQYDGALDDLRLWNVARTPAEIQASMATELSGGEPGLVAYWKLNEGTGAAVADDSAGNHTASLYNGPSSLEGGPVAPAVPDVTPPDIANVTVGNLADTSVTIAFETSETATAWVSYSAGTSCPCSDVYSSTPGTSHTVTLSGLAPNTTYQFAVKATDGAANLQVSPTASFTTLLPLPDVTPPSVAVVTPPAGSVAGTVVVEAAATDNVGVASVQFKVDGVDAGTPDTSAPYSISLDTTLLDDGPHTISAEARDAVDNAAIAAVTVTVANTTPPTSPHYVDLDGVDDYLQAADADGLSFGNGTSDTALTFEAWIRPDAMVRHHLISKWYSASSEYKLHIASGRIRLDLHDSTAQATVSAFTTNSQPLIGSWHHLAVTYDGRGGAAAADGIAIYIDGVSVALTRFNNAAYVAMENLSAPLQIGREGPNWKQYDGGLDELRLWNVARTAGEIQSGMASGLSGLEPGLVAYWKFSEGTGTTAGDESAGDHTATMVSGPAWVAGGPVTP
jgi:hypothetical protein